MRMCHFRAQNGSLVMNKIFLVQTIIITFIYLLALFTVQNSKKFLPQIQSYEDAHFLTQNVPFAPNTFFLENYNHYHLPVSHFHCIIKKKILPADPEL